MYPDSVPEEKSLLEKPRMSDDSVVLEMFFVRFPFGDPQINERLWREVDEQHFPVELRRRLWRNGFRVGLIDGQIPVVLSNLMELDNKPSPAEGTNQIELADLATEPSTIRRHLQIRSGQRSEIVTSGEHDLLTVLLSQQGQLCGQTYTKAQTTLAVKTYPQHDGRVRLEIVPEVHHGEVRQRWAGKQGTWRLEPGRPRRVFDEMQFSALLAPGNVLLLSSLPDLPGSLGHHFFTEENGRLEQKLLLIRLAQTQHDGLFTPPEVLRLEE